MDKRRANGVPFDPVATLGSAFRGALSACRALEPEPALPGLRFASDEVELRFLDRRLTPNEEVTRESLTAVLAEFVADLYQPAAAQLDWDALDPRRPLSLRVSTPDALDLDNLIARLA